MLKKPSLAKCSDRTKFAKIHPTAGEPKNWLNETFLKPHNLLSLSFDFFVNWNQLTIGSEIWIKRIVRDDYYPWPTTDIKKIIGWINKVDTEKIVNSLTRFCRAYEIDCHYLLFKESTDWPTDSKNVVDIDITSTSPEVSLWNVSGIRHRIRTLRSTTVPIGPGGLIYGTSSLECFLSHTPDFWPGDVDSVLVDSNSAVHGILEYKKHTLSGPIESQTLLNYRDRDKLKYQSLGLLRDRFSENNVLPILMIYYPTQQYITNVKIEKLAGRYDQLTVSAQRILPLPNLASSASCQKFTNTIVDML